jgi:hypothetical protein
MSLAAQSPAAIQEGIVEVNGYAWTVNPVAVDLNDIAPTNNGSSRYTVLEILEEGQNGQYRISQIPRVTINLPGKLTGPGCSGDQIRGNSNQCPTFRSTPDATIMSYKAGSQTRQVEYRDYNPQIYIEKADDMSVDLSPPSAKIDSGGQVRFTTDVSGDIGAVTYEWDFGDGTKKTTSKGSISHTFKGSNRTYTVVVSVTSTGNPRSADDLSTITVGKVKKKPADQNPNQKNPDNSDNGGGGETTESTPYVPGYSGGSTGGTGGGSPGASPNTSPGQPKREKQQPANESSGQTVTGQLIDPASIATATPSTGDSTAATEQASPDDGSGGGGIPDGAKAALGIGALLGLGGLAEAGAFTGAFRRIRFRL